MTDQSKILNFGSAVPFTTLGLSATTSSTAVPSSTTAVTSSNPGSTTANTAATTKAHPTSSPASNLGRNIGLGVGIPVALIVVGILFFVFWRRRNTLKESTDIGIGQRSDRYIFEKHGEGKKIFEKHGEEVQELDAGGRRKGMGLHELPATPHV
jgi:hypothetical protein